MKLENLLVIVLVLISLISVSASQLSSENYNLSSVIVDSGGTNVSSTTYKTNSVLGTITGAIVGSTKKIFLGFFHTIFGGCTTPYYGLVLTSNTNFCPGTYYLNGTTGTAINLSNDGIVLDCAGAVLIGNSSDYGIFINQKTGVTVKNCIVGNFSTGVLVYKSYDSLIYNITAYNNTGTGMTDDRSNNTNFSRIYAYNNYRGAIINSNYTKLIDSVFMNNTPKINPNIIINKLKIVIRFKYLANI